ncbi:MAG: MFS transporter [Acidimicrobiales bacterium]
MAVGDRVDQFRALAREAIRDLFDQNDPIGRLALVQVVMLAGDTLVAISLAGSLFFSISPTEAKSKVLLYLVLTLAPFAVVSPLLGPLVDRSRGARKVMVVFSALGRAVLCPLMARDTHSLLLFPEAFLILVLSKLYLVTRGALVPEMASISRERGGNGAVGGTLGDVGFAALNARLTLLGTLAGFIASIPGVLVLKLVDAPGVLVFATLVFFGAVVAGTRLPTRRRLRRSGPTRGGPTPSPAQSGRGVDRRGVVGGPGGAGDPAVAGGAGDAVNTNLRRLVPIAHPEVILGLTTISLIRGLAGFLVFLLAFGLRREHASLLWYGFALGLSGVGSLIGLVSVARLRKFLKEQQMILMAIWFIAVGATGAAFWGNLGAQMMLAFCVGTAGAVAQPSFDAMTQRYVPSVSQGRAFAKFATREQLVWVCGALIPVVVTFPFPDGDIVIALVAGVGGLFYVASRRALRDRAVPRSSRLPPER